MGIASSDQSKDQTTDPVENEVPVEINTSDSAELAAEDDEVCSVEEGDNTGEKDSAHPPGGLDPKDPPLPDPAPQTAEPAGGPLSEESRCGEVQNEPTDDSSTISGMAPSHIHEITRIVCLLFLDVRLQAYILSLPHRQFGLTKWPRLQSQRGVYRPASRARRGTSGNPLR
jgi:hypothetical protein